MLHILFFLIAEKTINFKLLGTADIPEEINEPIVFDLSETEKPRQVIETTEDQRSQKKPEKPEYLSDKNTTARNNRNFLAIFLFNRLDFFKNFRQDFFEGVFLRLLKLLNRKTEMAAGKWSFKD